MKKLIFIFFVLLLSGCITEKRMQKLCTIASLHCNINRVDTVIIKDTIIDFQIKQDTLYFYTSFETLQDTVIIQKDYIVVKSWVGLDSLINIQTYLVDSILQATLQVTETIKYVDKPFK